MAPPRVRCPSDAPKTIQKMAAEGHTQLGIAAFFKVHRSTLMKWIEKDERLKEAYDAGKDTERQKLHSIIMRDALAGKPANVNAFFLLKCRHGYIEADKASNVNLAIEFKPVLVMTDHGSDDEWARKAEAQQRALTLDAGKLPAPQLEAPQPFEPTLPNPASVFPEVTVAPAYAPAAWKPGPNAVMQWEVPIWKKNA